MAYFLKKSNLKKGTYLQIYFSFYNKEKKQTRHKSIESLGYVSDLIGKGYEDPIEYFSNLVDEMNDKRNKKLQEDKIKKISNSPLKYLGYFPIKHIFNHLDLKIDLNYLQFLRDFQFQISDLIEALIYSRMVNPSSFKTFNFTSFRNFFFK